MQRRDANVVLAVKDLGVGCSPERVLATAESGGFGLFNIRERLRVIGGTLRVESLPESGCRVELECPLEIADPRTPSSSRRAGSEGPWSRTGTSARKDPTRRPAIRVMIVDDHKIMREGLSGILEDEEGIEVVAEAADGREAIERIDEAEPDVVIMDVSMPRMDGVEATAWIKRERPGIRVIGLSMHSHEDLSDAMLQAGALSYLTKGCPSGDLVAAIRRAGALG